MAASNYGVNCGGYGKSLMTLSILRLGTYDLEIYGCTVSYARSCRYQQYRGRDSLRLKTFICPAMLVRMDTGVLHYSPGLWFAGNEGMEKHEKLL